MSNEKEFYTVLEAAKYLEVSRTKVSQLIKDGKLVVTENPLDQRQSLITKNQLDKLRAFPKAARLKEEETPPAAGNKLTSGGRDRYMVGDREIKPGESIEVFIDGQWVKGNLQIDMPGRLYFEPKNNKGNMINFPQSADVRLPE